MNEYYEQEFASFWKFYVKSPELSSVKYCKDGYEVKLSDGAIFIIDESSIFSILNLPLISVESTINALLSKAVHPDGSSDR